MATNHPPPDWTRIERRLTGRDVRAIGKVNLRDCSYCEVCAAVTVDPDTHAEFHVAVLAMFRELRRQHGER